MKNINSDDFLAYGNGPAYAGASNQRFLTPVVGCANPHCEKEVPVRGEFCRDCRRVQQQMRGRLRATKDVR